MKDNTPSRNIPVVCDAVNDVVVMLQYNKNAEKEIKIVNGIEMCVLDNFSRIGFLNSCRDPWCFGFISDFITVAI